MLFTAPIIFYYIIGIIQLIRGTSIEVNQEFLEDLMLAINFLSEKEHLALRILMKDKINLVEQVDKNFRCQSDFLKILNRLLIKYDAFRRVSDVMQTIMLV
jgi:hypothetical protein